ncbi:hypothetical protein HMPREF0322_04764 [Desulfitobacterium hafniense DP7]|uniref:Uncharacterized protein n=1 Tax=Desulfitobacterium hafniense DP7 TaxID=537010 RepID=G9XUV1_DESHA|nr:hypothetical protein HMPREF0322_04764 [Desulfitobacterium hafniense DP7]
MDYETGFDAEKWKLVYLPNVIRVFILVLNKRLLCLQQLFCNAEARV